MCPHNHRAAVLGRAQQRGAENAQFFLCNTSIDLQTKLEECSNGQSLTEALCILKDN
jgi:hypothetical protein